MSTVESGKILVGSHQGIYVIKMIGEVRLTLCIPFDDYIESLFVKDDFCTIMFDLSEAQGLDSTTLGLMAKLAVRSERVKQIRPMIIGAQAGIDRLLDMTGITEVCELVRFNAEDYCVDAQLKPLKPHADSLDEDHVRDKVLEAHCTLMALSAKNQEAFRDLVNTLK
ncbi:MAG: STAS domain-containing protein [Cellvibrionaceae bacterium]|nr:STAS domain-containing protein [Cellvibrionaceae bacterium]